MFFQYLVFQSLKLKTASLLQLAIKLALQSLHQLFKIMELLRFSQLSQSASSRAKRQFSQLPWDQVSFKPNQLALTSRLPLLNSSSQTRGLWLTKPRSPRHVLDLKRPSKAATTQEENSSSPVESTSTPRRAEPVAAASLPKKPPTTLVRPCRESTPRPVPLVVKVPHVPKLESHSLASTHEEHETPPPYSQKKSKWLNYFEKFYATLASQETKFYSEIGCVNFDTKSLFVYFYKW